MEPLDMKVAVIILAALLIMLYFTDKY